MKYFFRHFNLCSLLLFCSSFSALYIALTCLFLPEKMILIVWQNLIKAGRILFSFAYTLFVSSALGSSVSLKKTKMEWDRERTEKSNKNFLLGKLATFFSSPQQQLAPHAFLKNKLVVKHFLYVKCKIPLIFILSMTKEKNRIQIKFQLSARNSVVGILWAQ